MACSIDSLLQYAAYHTQEYPDYYEVIKKPVDMQKVFQRMMAGQYCSLEDMVSDFVLMFDNACRYNEPDSLIYKVCKCRIPLRAC